MKRAVSGDDKERSIVRSIYVSIPSYSGKVDVKTMASLLDFLHGAWLRGWRVKIDPIKGCSPLSSARNIALSRFLKGEWTDFVQVDDDLAWESGALLRLVEAEQDFVVGCYPYRELVQEQPFPVQWLEGPIEVSSSGLIELRGAPVGFSRLKREALLAFLKNRPTYHQIGAEGERAPLAFHFELFHDELWSEDLYFCRKWRASGRKVWCDPDIRFWHAGVEGNLAEWMASETQKRLGSAA